MLASGCLFYFVEAASSTLILEGLLWVELELGFTHIGESLC
jgi:hypothetical protein